MMDPILNDEQREALQEIANIGMGQAGASIAKVLSEFVVLSIPRISSAATADFSDAVARLVGDTLLTAVRQAFIGEFRGEALVIYPDVSVTELGAIMGYDDTLDRAAEQEIMLDIANVLIGACLNSIADLLGLMIGFSMPSLMAENVPASQLLGSEELESKCALLVEVNFKLEKGNFSCHLVILTLEDDIATLSNALDKFIATL
ncbi:hypothetical protein FNU76_00765 [Chitinimonas arctica]|uniref:Chemotaxis protein CheC n=1 Tax=Chitinimonas arctica TaxID=2594795 RepID=A0A516SA14_9NEIS|nr:hypothetical protein [Chitinimonas arctica]QDQ24995.1 hypothetical protein FNU76_00765 [Chitinimonas arctica]